MLRNPYLAYYKDTLDRVRTEINYFKRQERAILKDFRKNCPHYDVKRLASKTPAILPRSVYDYNSTYVNDYFRYKVVCNDCGKVLQK